MESSECVSYNVVRALLEEGPADPGFDTMGIAAAGYSVQFSGVPMMRNIMQDVMPDSLYQAFVLPESDAANMQAQLFFNQERNTLPLRVRVDGTYSIPVFSSPRGAQTNDPDERYALFEGTDHKDGSVTLADGTEREMLAWDFIRSFDSLADPALVLDETARREAWRRADEWLGELGPIVDAFRTDTDYRGVAAELEGFVADLDTVIPLLCVLLATELAMMESESFEFSAVVMYLAADELLLATEYLEVIRDHMTATGVDWFRGPSADNTIAADGSTSTAEDFIVWQYALDYALSHVVLFRSGNDQFPPPSIPQSGAN